MGGRLVDWLGQGVAADRPLAAAVAGLTNSQGVAIYFANDTKILSFYDHTGPIWFDVDIAAVSAISFQTLPDVDWSTPPTDGQVFAWDTASSKLIPYTIPALPTTEELQDVVGAMFANGTGITASYDDGTGMILIDCTITQYTDEMAMDSLAAAFAAGTHVGVSITYDDALNKFDLALSLAAAADIWGWSNNNKAVTADAIADASTPVAVAYAATVALDFDTGFNFDIGDLTGNILIDNPTNADPGKSGVIHIQQDGTGGWTASWGSNWRFPGGAAAAVLSTAPNAEDELSYFVRTDGTIFAVLLLDVKA